MPKFKWELEYGWFALFAICTIGFSLVQDVIRPQYRGDQGVIIYMLGVLPNFFPAIGLPALFMVLIPYFSPKGSASEWVRGKIHVTAMLISACGLIAWEFQQHFTPNGYFDWHDVLWTLIGTGCFYFLVTRAVPGVCGYPPASDA